MLTFIFAKFIFEARKNREPFLNVPYFLKKSVYCVKKVKELKRTD